ncbi:SCO family protein [Methylibium sp.]|uniref:SCO family protein n=1 Tax=Methylibium sp. TaxID=2067992 RepID=UPI003D0E1608
MSGSNFSTPGSAGSARSADAAAAEPLSFAVHSLPTPMLPSAQVRHGRLKMLLVLLVCAAPVIASYVTYYVIRPQGRTNHGLLIQPQRPLPASADLPLTDLQGADVAPATLEGQWLLVVVAGGGCDTLCERQLYLQRQLRESLGKNKDRLDRVWLIDDEAAPRAELLPALQGATVLRAPAAALGRWLEPAAGQFQGAHFYLVDPRGNYMMRFPAPSEPERIKRDLEKLMRAASGWDEPGR